MTQEWRRERANKCILNSPRCVQTVTTCMNVKAPLLLIQVQKRTLSQKDYLAEHRVVVKSYSLFQGPWALLLLCWPRAFSRLAEYPTREGATTESSVKEGSRGSMGLRDPEPHRKLNVYGCYPDTEHLGQEASSLHLLPPIPTLYPGLRLYSRESIIRPHSRMLALRC